MFSCPILKFCDVNDTLEMAELEFSQELDWRDYHSSHEYSDNNEGTQNGSHTLDGETQVGHFMLYLLFKGALSFLKLFWQKACVCVWV